jgi:hypothetical protein
VKSQELDSSIFEADLIVPSSRMTRRKKGARRWREEALNNWISKLRLCGGCGCCCCSAFWLKKIRISSRPDREKKG